MAMLFVIEDETHAEWCSEHHTFDEAVSKLQELAAIPWDQQPNAPPCSSWRTCGRRYEVVEFDTSRQPWKEIRRLAALEISAKGGSWGKEFQP
jgi:hypothetical protein